MKKFGNLFEKAFTIDSLYDAWLSASKGKLNKGNTLEFGANLASNLFDLYIELQSGTYKPRPHSKFIIHEPKLRTIYAPHFRDFVVQHAIYKIVYPIFNSTFVDQNYACRVGKGTHKAADYAQSALRSCDSEDYLLQLDIRKFFYRIDRDILRSLLERKLKDNRFIDIMMSFTEHGEEFGIPIGNLLSQLYALIYLNKLDHYIKRELKCKLYCRYVDDFVIFGISRQEGLYLLEQIKTFIDKELHLELSRHSLHKIKRGINFVGYRTWKSRRYIRKHSMFKLFRSAKKNKLDSVISILGHSMNTSSRSYLLRRLRLNHSKIYRQLPSTLNSYNKLRSIQL